MDEIKDQYRAWGFPEGPKAKNADRQKTLDFLQRRRNSDAKPATLDGGDGSFGYMALAIPELDYYVLLHRFPDLASKDREIHHRAWKKFAESEASLPYRTDASVGRRKPNRGIIVR